MKKIAGLFRSMIPVNRVFRRLLKKSEKLLTKLIRVWHLYGVVDMEFDGVPFKMYSKGDDNVVHAHFYNIHYHEMEDLRFFSHMAKKANVVFDIGANTGIYSILSEKKSPQAKVFAFEPYHINLERLRKNLELNNSQVEVVEKAVGGRVTKVDFAVRDFDVINDASSVNIEYSKKSYGGNLTWKTIQVDQITLDSFCYEKNLHHVDLVKIDVEGYEEAVFRGAVNVFKSKSPVIQCEIALDEDKKIFFDNFLKEFDYCAYFLMRDGILRIDQEMLENPGRVNYLFAKHRTEKIFTSYNEIDELADQLLKKENKAPAFQSSTVVSH